MASIRTLIVDDEPLARRRVAQLLAAKPGFVVQGECANGAEAVAFLAGEVPVDLLFLDVHLPDMSGLQVLQQVQHLPLVVFVTAYDQYTLQAFDNQAVDYLLKPLDPDRFGRCLTHVCQRMEHRGDSFLHQQLAALLGTLPTTPTPVAYPTRLLIKQPGHFYFVPTAQVQYLAAAANYVTVHAQTAQHVLRATLGQLEQQLDPDQFLRIHRSFIVNMQQVKELHPWAHGEYLLTLHDGTHLNSSRSYAERLQHFLKQFIS